ncbi:MAG: hypothetical protein SGJ20_05050 [Planctomycetota bacterium]|nr:hypothetical protein [Planctomycetota bacterium]
MDVAIAMCSTIGVVDIETPDLAKVLTAARAKVEVTTDRFIHYRDGELQMVMILREANAASVVKVARK